ncbi:hypothetical protein BC567DRAFT_259698 [Phyllosticta citribraziliensis]
MVAGGWDDFSNNLATDLTPLISLFGEQPTKQFLSESTTLTDIFIFSMAPLGVLTAIISAVRAGGTPSLRAFIGRAQEGGANVEIELCSSTSRDVCEMYNNGGISRVLGRPKIIELVQDTRATNDEFYNGGSAGLYSFKDYVQKDRGQSDWKETTLDNSLRYRKNFGTEKASAALPSGFAPNPNLSLNIGIKKPPFLWFIVAALCGFLLQSAVMVFAALTTYRLRDQFKKDDAYVADYAFPCTLIGTVLLALGVGLCAYVVTKTSKQRVFRKQPDCSCRLFWIQPGNQIIGDQVFDSFAFSESIEKPMTEYTTKWKETQRKNKQVSILVWSAISLSICGFVLQFLGLRALHSSVSVAQLGVMIVMSAVRAGLRTRRMDIEDSPMSQDPEFYEGHELDWVAFEMGRKEIRSSLSCQSPADTKSGDGSPKRGYSSSSGLQSEQQDTLLFQVAGFPKLGGIEVYKEPVHHDWQWSYDSQSMVEIQRVSIVNEECESTVELLSGLIFNNLNKRDVHVGESERERLVKDCRMDLQKTKVKDIPRLLPRIFLWRTRLSGMTSNWEEKHAPVRKTAMDLKKAIEDTAAAIFDCNVQDQSPTLFKENWKDVITGGKNGALYHIRDMLEDNIGSPKIFKMIAKT